MKVVKPMAVSFSFRPFVVGGRQQLSVSSLIGFSLGEGVRRLVSEIKLWPAIGEVIQGVVDEGLPKPSGEVLAYGSCFAPGGASLPLTTARLWVAPAGSPTGSRAHALVDKTLAIFGDRYWSGTAVRSGSTESVLVSHRASDPVPFSEMPLAWDRAFGGENFPKNPVGRGMTRVTAEGGLERLPLPNLELPSALVTSSSDRPDPASFAPIDVIRPQRQAKGGTYGEKWLEDEFPGFPRDIDPTFFSTASDDQRLDGFFRGDEEYLLENMHPTCPVLRGRLPGVAARVLVRRKGEEGFEEVRMTLDTVVFMPGKEIGILVFRGLTPLVEDDAADIVMGFTACEEMDAPRSTEHYRKAIEKRLDKDRGALAVLNESDLLPPFAAGCGIAEVLGKGEDPHKAHRDRVLDRTLARVRQQLVKQKVKDPDAVLAKATEKSPLIERLERMPNAADPNDLAEYMDAVEAFQAYSEERRQKASDAARQQLDKLEQNLKRDADHSDASSSPEVEERRRAARRKIDGARRALAGEPPAQDAPATGDGPPKPKAPDMLALFKQANIEPDPKHVSKLQQADSVALDIYRRSAHLRPPARHLEPDARERARRALIESAAAGRLFAEVDWTRHDLSALDLRGADLQRALLEGADLTETNLAGADLAGAVLAHAVLRRTCLDGANLEGANLGAAAFEDATFVGANFTEAILHRSRLVSVSWAQANLTNVNLVEAQFGAVDFEGALADGIKFLPKPMLPTKGEASKQPPVLTDLTKCRFALTRLRKANFLNANVAGVDFTGAELESATFLSVTADGASFRGASLRRFQAVKECSFAGACFDGADLSGAFLRGSNFRGASFEGALLEGTDLSECDLTGAKLSRAQAKGVRLIHADLTDAKVIGADLMNGMMQKANLNGADLSGANLFGGNLGKIRLDTATRIRGANLKRALMLPKAKVP